MTSTTVQTVSSWLKSKSIVVPNDWISACLEWMASENHNLNNTAAIKKMVYEQWLLTNLRDFGQSILPPEIMESKLTLKGTYCVQVDSVMDISQPKYSQLLQTQNKENVNTFVTAETQATQKPWEVKSSRMLMLSITDGVKDISAMEYTSIPALNDKMPPGAKIMIRGPVVCRRGVVMLKPTNVELLGGEVEDLLASNNNEAILCRGLNRPITNTSKQINLSTKQKEYDDDADLDQLLLDVDIDCGNNVERSIHTTEECKKRIAQSDSIIISDDEAIDEFVGGTVQIQSNVPMNEYKTPCYSPSDTASEKRQKLAITKNKHSNILLLPERKISENNCCSSISMKKESNKIPVKKEAICVSQSKKTVIQKEKTTENTACKTDSEQIMKGKYLQKNKTDIFESDQICLCHVKNLLMKTHSDGKLKIVIKAIVITLLSKLKSDILDGWGLKARICDGTGLLDVHFSNNILQSLIGFTVSEAGLIKQSSDKYRRDELKVGLDKCREIIISTCHQMHIEVKIVSNCLEGFITSVEY